MEFKTYVARVPGADVERFRLSPEGAKEHARILSEALCPEVAEVCDTKTHDVLAIFVDGTEYHPSLGDLARSPEAFARGYEARRLAESPIYL